MWVAVAQEGSVGRPLTRSAVRSISPPYHVLKCPWERYKPQILSFYELCMMEKVLHIDALYE